jgi:hypothetical protein
MTLSNLVTVQPHPGLTSKILSSAVPVFLIRNACSIGAEVRITTPASWTLFSMIMFGFPSCAKVFAKMKSKTITVVEIAFIKL